MSANGIDSSAKAFLAPDEPVEIWEFELANKSEKLRKLMLVPYVEWGLGGYATFSSALSYLRSRFDRNLKAALSCNTSDERPHDR